MRARVRLFGVLMVVTAAGIGACDLNPQPIPPGDQADGGSNSDFGGGTGGDEDATTANPAPGDSGTQNLDSGPDEDTGVPETDGGEDASDAEADAI